MQSHSPNALVFFSFFFVILVLCLLLNLYFVRTGERFEHLDRDFSLGCVQFVNYKNAVTKLIVMYGLDALMSISRWF